MSNQLAPTNFNIEKIDPTNKSVHEKGAMAIYGLLIFTQQAGKVKNSVSEKAAEITRDNDKIKLIQDILRKISKLSNDKEIDLNQHPEIQEKLKIAKEFGVEFDEKNLKLNFTDQTFLKDSLKAVEDELVSNNKLQTQRMQMLIQEAERWMTLANTLVKNTDRNTRSYIEKIR